MSSHNLPPPSNGEIVVTARRTDALVPPETELDEADIRGFGAGTIAELLQRVGPLIGGGDDQPIILINGRPVGATSIAGFPPEALLKLAILKPEAAGRYGYRPDRRVVNLVLKPEYETWQSETRLTLATAGGRDSERLSVGRYAVRGDTLWNVKAEVARDSILYKSERPLAAHAPPIARDGLSAFLPTADRVRSSNPNDFDALLPGRRDAGFTAGVTRPVGDYTGTLNVNANINDSEQPRGLPVRTPMPPSRVLTGLEPLRSRQTGTSLGVSLNLSGPVGGWRSNVSLGYSRAWSNSRFDRGADMEVPQHSLDEEGNGFNPNARLPARAIETEHNRSRSELINARLQLDKNLWELPAGPLTTTISTAFTHNSLNNERWDTNGSDPTDMGVRRNQYDLRASLNIPLTSRSADALAALGDIALGLASSASAITGTPLQKEYDASISWMPFSALQLFGALSASERAPSVQQLNGPRVQTIVRIYDPIRQEVAEPIWITGGNPDLEPGRQQSLALSGTLRPLGARLLTLGVAFRRDVAKGVAAGLPELTPAIDAAFRERFVRDDAGRLVVVDARPISIDRKLEERLDSNMTVAFPLSAKGDGSGPGGPDGRAWQLRFTVNHGWLLRSEIQTRPDLPALDQLDGAGAQSRHTVGFQLVVGRPGVGLTLDGSWQSPFRVSAPHGSGARELNYRSTTTLNLRLAAEPAEYFSNPSSTSSWLSDLNITIDIRNLLDSYRRVRLGDGRAAPGYARYEVDPLGRTVQLSIRKRF